MKEGIRRLATLAVTIVASNFCAAQAPMPVGESSFAPTVFDHPGLVAGFEETITAEELAAHLYLFASDFFEGRASATRGQKLAAHYLASEYLRLGLRPMGNGKQGQENILGTFMQPFPVYAERLHNAVLTARVGDNVVRTVFGVDESDGHSYLLAGTVRDVTGPIVFAGYGISESEYGYDDFAALKRMQIDHRSAWIMILRDEPLADAGTSLLATANGSPSEWTMQPLLKYLSIYRKLRPKGIIVVGDVGPRAPPSFPREIRARAESLERIHDLSLDDDISAIPYIPIYVVSSEFADELLKPSDQSVRQLQTKINDGLAPVVFDIPEVSVTSRLTRRNVRLQTENVVAMIEGSDPVLRDEYVVISSHYDHIGLADGRDGDFVNNGADDDGSGTVAALEMAEAFRAAQKAGYGPRRSLLFVHFSGEEQGLLGSEFFTDVDPVVPLDKIVTVLNMDMIGRVDPTYTGDSDEYVYVIGSRLISEELHELTARVNVLMGRNIELDERFNSRSDPNRFYARSDHWNFAKHGIPFIFFFTGIHEDYHQPGDEPHKIRYDRLTNITKLIFATAWQVANQPRRPAVSGKGFN